MNLLSGNREIQPVDREPIAILLREIMSLDRATFRQRSSQFMRGIAEARAI